MLRLASGLECTAAYWLHLYENCTICKVLPFEVGQYTNHLHWHCSYVSLTLAPIVRILHHTLNDESSIIKFFVLDVRILMGPVVCWSVSMEACAPRFDQVLALVYRGDDMKLTPLRGAPGNRSSIFGTFNQPLSTTPITTHLTDSRSYDDEYAKKWKWVDQQESV